MENIVKFVKFIRDHCKHFRSRGTVSYQNEYSHILQNLRKLLTQVFQMDMKEPILRHAINVENLQFLSIYHSHLSLFTQSSSPGI